jgi:CHAT domain-containing protein/tetratricopeptide (TPR) repeat protein
MVRATTLALALGGAPALAQETATRLPPEASVERELGPKASHAYLLGLEAGQFVGLTVYQVGVDVAVAVVGPDGRPVAEAGFVAAAGGAEFLAFVATAPGHHRVEIRGIGDDPSRGGRYELRVEGPRRPTDQDRQRAEAERAMAEGEKLRQEQKAESTRRSLERFQRSRELWRGLGNTQRELEALISQGAALVALAEYAEGLERTREALAVARAIGDRYREGGLLNRIGSVLFDQGRAEEAIEHLRPAAEARREAGDLRGEAESLNNLAVSYAVRGEIERAVETLSRAFDVTRTSGDRKGMAVIAGNLALRLADAGAYQKALDLNRRVLPIRRELNDRNGEATTLNNLGVLYRDLGDYRRALDYYQQAIGIYESLGNRRNQAAVLNNIGVVHNLAGDPAQAAESHRRALELRRAVGDRGGEALSLTNLARALQQLGERAEAAQLLQQSLALARQADDPYAVAAALGHLAGTHADAGQLDAARAEIIEAIAIHDRLKEPRLMALARYRLAEIEKARGDLPEARRQVEAALRLVERLRSRLTSQDLRVAYLATVREIYDLSVDVLMELHARDPSAGLDAAALEVAERARARSLLDLLAEARVDIRDGVDETLLRRERALKARLRAADERRLRAGGAADTPKTFREIESLTAELDQVESGIRAASPRYAALTQPEPLSAAGLRELLDPDTLLLEYVLAEPRSYLWVATAGSVTGHLLPPRAEILELGRRAYQSLSTRPERAAALGPGGDAAALSRILLGPVADRLAGQRLVIVADGVLQYLPFAALPHPVSGEALVTRHEVTGIPSASTLAVLRRELADRPPAARTLVVLADPVFEATDERIRKTQAAAEPEVETETATEEPSLLVQQDLTRAAGDAGLPAGLPRLPFTRREARAIAGLVPRGQAREALDFDASRATATDADLGRYRFVHFATHGLLNTAHAGLSGIVLSLVDRDGRPQDGFLTARDVFNLRLSADLVVLSGCRTGLGKDVRGEGLLGLTRGLMYAGSPRVVASLWKVDDSATAELMESFYRGMLKKNLAPAAALRRAQLEMMKRTRWRHPFYWAAFQLQGEWR